MVLRLVHACASRCSPGKIVNFRSKAMYSEENLRFLNILMRCRLLEHTNRFSSMGAFNCVPQNLNSNWILKFWNEWYFDSHLRFHDFIFSSFRRDIESSIGIVDSARCKLSIAYRKPEIHSNLMLKSWAWRDFEFHLKFYDFHVLLFFRYSQEISASRAL